MRGRPQALSTPLTPDPLRDFCVQRVHPNATPTNLSGSVHTGLGRSGPGATRACPGLLLGAPSPDPGPCVHQQPGRRGPGPRPSRGVPRGWGLPRPAGRSGPWGKPGGVGAERLHNRGCLRPGTGSRGLERRRGVVVVERVGVPGPGGRVGNQGVSRGSGATRAAGEGAAPCWEPSAAPGRLPPEGAWGGAARPGPRGTRTAAEARVALRGAAAAPGPRTPCAAGRRVAALGAKPPDQSCRLASPVPRFLYLHVRRRGSMAPGPRSALRSGPRGCHGDGPLCGRGGAGARGSSGPAPDGEGGERGRGGEGGNAGGGPGWALPPRPSRPRPRLARRGAGRVRPGSGSGTRRAASTPRPGRHPGAPRASGEPRPQHWGGAQRQTGDPGALAVLSQAGGPQHPHPQTGNGPATPLHFPGVIDCWALTCSQEPQHSNLLREDACEYPNNSSVVPR